MEEFLQHGSYFGIILVLVLTGCGLPLPEEVAIIFAALMSTGSEPVLNVWLALGSCMIGAILGDSVMYFIGHHFGRSGLREHPFLVRHLSADRERAIEQAIANHGLKVFFLSRFMIGVRAPVYITCGILRIRFRWFLLADAISATVVVNVVFWLTFFFGDQVRPWIRKAEWGVTIVVLLAAVIVGAILYVKFRKKKQQLLDELSADEKSQDASESANTDSTSSEEEKTVA
jgi:membrane protein DedA with SNARE-associated domain